MLEPIEVSLEISAPERGACGFSTMSLQTFKVGPDIRISSAIHTLPFNPDIDIAPISTCDTAVKDKKTALGYIPGRLLDCGHPVTTQVRRISDLPPGMFDESAALGGFVFDPKGDVGTQINRICEMLVRRAGDERQAEEDATSARDQTRDADEAA